MEYNDFKSVDLLKPFIESPHNHHTINGYETRQEDIKIFKNPLKHVNL